MARSPSPTGSSYSRRSRHDDHDRRRDDRRERDRERERERDRNRDRDRDRKDDRRDRRRRSRSRSPARNDRRYRADSRDRHYSRRDRSRNRDSRRPRDLRDDRRRSPDRYRRDGSRERERKRRDDSADSRRERRRPDSREKRSNKGENATPAAAPAPTAEEKKAERLARLEEWKKKQLAAASEKKADTATPTSTRGLLDDMDRKAASSASPASPHSPASPKPYAGKFDPKAIVKKATANSAAANKLGLDVALPEGVPQKPATVNGNAKAATGNKASTVSLKASGNLSGFGLGSKASETQKTNSGLDFDDEEGEKRKLEKLPNTALEKDGEKDAALANGAQEDGNEVDDDDDDDDVDMQDGTEEEAAAAARAAAEKREERLHAQNVAYQEGDTAMQDAEPTHTEPQGGAEDEMEEEEDEEEEEVDPLDAFMADLGSRPSAPNNSLRMRGKKNQDPVAMFGDDDTMDAVDDENTDDIMAMAASKRKKKDIPKVDHAKVEYETFRRNFYHEPSELSGMSEEDLADLRLELDGIKVRGVDAPKPVISWAQCGLGVQTLDVVSKLNYEKPSAIQSQAIPSIMSGRDVIGVAKTGSGKTIAFLLPMFRHIKDQRPLDNLEGPVALIMTPTRELATQIHRDCKPFLKALNLRAVCAYGGARIKDQIAELKRGAEVVVCTPGRMIDLLAANAGRVTNLKRVTYCVLDEADRMFDMGFEPQVMKILGNIRPDRQTVLFSATFPKQMEALARKTLNKPVEIIVGGRSVVAPEITQIIEVRPEESKFLRLLELLGELYADDASSEDYRALIFVERQESADSLLRDLMRKGYPCMSIHGGKDQIDRDSTIHDFKAGVVPILVATSVAARGLDVKQLKLVVNFDAPNHLEDYVHRAGRTGRAGNTGTAVTFITEEQDRYSLDLAKALTQSGQEVPEALQSLVDSFKEKVKAGKEKAAGSGFGGRGLERLDQDRDAARNAQRKAYKTGDEGEEEEKEESGKSSGKNDDLIAKAASEVQAAGSSQTNKPLVGVPAGIDLDGKITVHKTETPAPSSANGAGGNGAMSSDPMERVRQVVGRLNSKVGGGGGVSSGAPLDNKGPDAGAYHATLEINDFPQKARWAVTNRTNVAKILEATGTSITTKGNFYAAGKEPAQGEQPKLYILVEGDTEIVVTNAMRELMTLLKQGTIAAAEGEARAPTGRYNVV